MIQKKLRNRSNCTKQLFDFQDPYTPIRECIPGPVFSLPEIGNVQTSFPGIRKCMAGRQCFQMGNVQHSLSIASLLAAGGLSSP